MIPFPDLHTFSVGFTASLGDWEAVIAAVNGMRQLTRLDLKQNCEVHYIDPKEHSMTGNVASLELQLPTVTELCLSDSGRWGEQTWPRIAAPALKAFKFQFPRSIPVFAETTPLESFTVSAPEVDRDSMNAWMMHWLGVSPHLKALTLWRSEENGSCKFLDELSKLPFAALLTANLGFDRVVNTASLLTFFRNNPRLKDVSLLFSDYGDRNKAKRVSDSVLSSSPMTMVNLRAFSVTNQSKSRVQFFSSLLLPNLDKLELDGPVGDLDTVLAACPALRSLRLELCDISPLNFLLTRPNRVEKLSLCAATTAVATTDAFFSFFSAFPRLRTLRIHVHLEGLAAILFAFLKLGAAGHLRNVEIVEDDESMCGCCC